MPTPELCDGVDVQETLVGCLADVLALDRCDIEPDRRFTELGLESFAALRLRRHLRERTGVDLPMATFLGDACLRSTAETLRQASPPGRQAPESAPRTLAGGQTTVVGNDADDSFALTAVQAAYWVGRHPDFALGGVATFQYHEFARTPVHRSGSPPELDLQRLEQAWNRLLDHHPMLRAVVSQTGRQRVLPVVETYRIGITDLRETASEQVQPALDALRHERSHQVRPAESWPLFEIHAALLPGGATRIFTGFDVLILDLASWMLLMRQWQQLVDDPSIELPAAAVSFEDLMRRRRRDSVELAQREEDRLYWAGRVDELPDGPRLPLTAPIEQLGVPRFTRHPGQLEPEQWSALRARAAAHGLSPTGALLAAFGLTLARWGATEPFCLNVTLFDRPDDVAGVDALVGDFTTTALVALPGLDQLHWHGFADYAVAANERFWSDLEHRGFSGVEARRESARPPDPFPRHPIVFTSGVGLDDGAGSPTAWLGTEVFAVSQTPQVLLDHIVWEEAGALRLAWDAVEGAFPSGFVTGMLAAHLRLLQSLSSDDAAWRRIDLGWAPDYRLPEPLIGRPFGDVGMLLDDPARSAALRSPQAPALLGPTGTVSHGDHAARADALATHLAAIGAGPGDLIAVVLPKGAAQIAAVHAINRCGAAYVPIEPSWPPARAAAVCEGAGLRHAVVAHGAKLELPPSVRTTAVDERGAPVEDCPGGALPPRTDADQLAYVIFTSGSTGTPKGVAVEHRAARTTIDDVTERFAIGPSDRVLALSALSFDLSVYDIFGVLGAGGALVVPDPARQRDPQHWQDLIAEHDVTVWNSAPALLEMLVEFAEADPAAAALDLASLRLVMLSGDWIPVTLPDRLRALAPGADVVSLGGATEASIWSICFPVGAIDPGWRSIPYGRPLRGQFFYVLDAGGRPCPVDEPGELFIAGGGLARGYIGDPVQTAQRFAEHPVLAERLYRTGDLGRWRYDGTIEFLGRADRQVKVRGHRIELGEIEAVLNRLPEVRQAVASTMPGPDSRPRLVAHVVANEPLVQEDSRFAERLSAALGQRLPEYMVPARFVSCEALPVTANGKIDHQGLVNPFDLAPGGEPDRRERRSGTRPDTSRGSVGPVDLGRGDGEAQGGDGSSALVALAPLLATSALEAASRGLELSLRVSAGSLPPGQALLAAAEWAAELSRRAEDAGCATREKLVNGQPEEGLIELHFAASVPAPSPATPPAATPASPPPPPPSQPRAPSGDEQPLGTSTAVSNEHAAMVADPETERRVAVLFAELLGHEVDAATSFFELGATSLTLVVANRRLRDDLAPALSVLDLFAYPTARELAARIDAMRQPEEPAPAAGHGPLSAAGARGRRRARAHAQARARETVR